MESEKDKKKKNEQNDTILSEDDIKKLWKDTKFCGAFSGITNFQSCLEMEKGVRLSKNKLFSILRKDPDFLIESRKVRKRFPRRRLLVHGVGQVWQADLAIMYSYRRYIGFLLCIDLFSRKIFCRSIRKKNQSSIKKAFEDIFDEAQLVPAKLETDQGQEFLSNKNFFENKNIYFKIKTGAHKAAFAERAIQTVKHRLYRLLRSYMTRNWPLYLNDIVQVINHSKKKAIGGLRPSDIISPLDDPKIDAAKGIPEDVSFRQQQKNQDNYEKNKKNLQVGDFVYVDFGPTTFAKGFDTPNYQIFEIKRIDAGKTPPLYYLMDLNQDDVKGSFYQEQLHKTDPPSPGKTFHVEKIVKERTRNGKIEVLVKYLHYPPKFNLWVLKKDIVRGRK